MQLQAVTGPGVAATFDVGAQGQDVTIYKLNLQSLPLMRLLLLHLFVDLVGKREHWVEKERSLRQINCQFSTLRNFPSSSLPS